jgi:hypothetical protein
VRGQVEIKSCKAIVFPNESQGALLQADVKTLHGAGNYFALLTESAFQANLSQSMTKQVFF